MRAVVGHVAHFREKHTSIERREHGTTHILVLVVSVLSSADTQRQHQQTQRLTWFHSSLSFRKVLMNSTGSYRENLRRAEYLSHQLIHSLPSPRKALVCPAPYAA